MIKYNQFSSIVSLAAVTIALATGRTTATTAFLRNCQKSGHCRRWNHFWKSSQSRSFIRNRTVSTYSRTNPTPNFLLSTRHYPFVSFPNFRLSIRKVMSSALLNTAITDDSKDDNQQQETKVQVLQFIDIGANLLDERFINGTYRGTYRHESDFANIIERATDIGMKKIIVTCGTIEESKQTIEMIRTKWRHQYPNIHFTCTVGVHPTRCQQVFCPSNDDVSGNNDQDQKDTILLQELLHISLDGMKDNTVVAIGEIGLDYDRLEFCSKDIQQKYLIKQLQVLARQTQLPLFLHNRSVGTDLYTILKEHKDCWDHNNDNGNGVVHSFDDTIELANLFINDLDFYIGINGCSLRTNENLQTVSQIQLNRILLETE